MTTPYVYMPQFSRQQAIPFVTAYHLTHTPFTPCIPDIHPSPSPRSSPGGKLPATPYLSPIELPPVGHSPLQNAHTLPSAAASHRRITSWPGVISSQPSSSPASRRSSVSTSALPIYKERWNTFLAYMPSPSYPISDIQPHLHPYLNSRTPGRSDFLFDLALPTFSPMRVHSKHIHPALLAEEELAHPATYPYLSTLDIFCDAIPQWPLTLKYHGAGPPQPMTLGDVLFVIHSIFHERVASREWAPLSKDQQTEVTRAYGRRCKRSGLEQAQRDDGVKKVDFLGRNVCFKGLEWVGDGRARLIVGC